jgi:hypothetical protein
MVRMDHSSTGCSQCGTHWYAIDSPEVARLSFQLVRMWFYAVEQRHSEFSRWGAPRYIVGSTMISCSGQCRAACDGFSPDVKRAIVRYLLGGQPSELEMEQEMWRLFVPVGKGESEYSVDVAQLCASLFRKWNSVRVGSPCDRYRVILDGRSSQVVEDVYRGIGGTFELRGLKAVDGFRKHGDGVSIWKKMFK